MEKFLAVIGALTVAVGALSAFLNGINFLIKSSSLVANSIWELKKYRFKRRKKNGDNPIIN